MQSLKGALVKEHLGEKGVTQHQPKTRPKQPFRTKNIQ